MLEGAKHWKLPAAYAAILEMIEVAEIPAKRLC
jgi:hypothetical protein